MLKHSPWASTEASQSAYGIDFSHFQPPTKLMTTAVFFDTGSDVQGWVEGRPPWFLPGRNLVKQKLIGLAPFCPRNMEQGGSRTAAA